MDQRPGRTRSLEAGQGSDGGASNFRRSVPECLDEGILDARLLANPSEGTGAHGRVRGREGSPKLGQPERPGAAGRVHVGEGRVQPFPAPLGEGSELPVRLRT